VAASGSSIAGPKRRPAYHPYQSPSESPARSRGCRIPRHARRRDDEPRLERVKPANIILCPRGTDLYALGAVGYFLLTGTPVFSEGSMVAVLSAHLHVAPTPPSQRLGRPVPDDLEALLLACLAKRPDDRPPSAAVLRDRLRACADAGRWTEAQAAAFWTSRRAAVGAAVASPVSVSAQTIAVDFERRSPTGAARGDELS
jgi:serine/threonine protein kinase